MLGRAYVPNTLVQPLPDAFQVAAVPAYPLVVWGVPRINNWYLLLSYFLHHLVEAWIVRLMGRDRLRHGVLPFPLDTALHCLFTINWNVGLCLGHRLPADWLKLIAVVHISRGISRVDHTVQLILGLAAPMWVCCRGATVIHQLAWKNTFIFSNDQITFVKMERGMFIVLNDLVAVVYLGILIIVITDVRVSMRVSLSTAWDPRVLLHPLLAHIAMSTLSRLLPLTKNFKVVSGGVRRKGIAFAFMGENFLQVRLWSLSF